MSAKDLTLSLMLGAVSITNAAPFQNLDFESANLPTLPPGQSGFFPIDQALPGWNALIGNFPTSQILYNGVSFGSAVVTIQGPNSGAPIIEGSYTPYLVPGYSEAAGTSVSVSLWQAGFIPTDAETILFQARSGSSVDPTFSLSMDGQQIPLVVLERNGRVIGYGADISAFSGTMAELRFIADGTLFLDNILFSSVPVPEPSTWAVFAAGTLLLGWASRKRLR